MSTEAIIDDQINVEGAPDIPGLVFRRFRGPSDYPKMVAVLEGSKEADQIEEVDNVERISKSYSNLKNCDPYRDMVFTEVDGQVVGYSRVLWREELDGARYYVNFGFLLPAWRGKGIGRAMIRHTERRLREIAAGHPEGTPRFFETEAVSTQPGGMELVQSEGYTPVRYAYDMIRSDLENIPDIPLPEGVEVRPVQPEQYRAIWYAEAEAFQDHFGAEPIEDADYERWLNDEPFQPHLWQVAWEGDQVVGMVRNFIDEDANTKFGRKRGYTENISVRRPWRRKGVARALIARSFKMLKDLGMTEAALGVDTENPNGALQLYESMGFREVKSYIFYRKPME